MEGEKEDINIGPNNSSSLPYKDEDEQLFIPQEWNLFRLCIEIDPLVMIMEDNSSTDNASVDKKWPHYLTLPSYWFDDEGLWVNDNHDYYADNIKSTPTVIGFGEEAGFIGTFNWRVARLQSSKSAIISDTNFKSSSTINKFVEPLIWPHYGAGLITISKLPLMSDPNSSQQQAASNIRPNSPKNQSQGKIGPVGFDERQDENFIVTSSEANVYIGNIPISLNDEKSAEKDDDGHNSQISKEDQTHNNNNPSQKPFLEMVSHSDYVAFSTGRTQISSGVIHLFRDFSTITLATPSSDEKREEVRIYRRPWGVDGETECVGAIYQFLDRSVVLLTAIPISVSPSALLVFLSSSSSSSSSSPGLEEQIQHIRLLRDAAPNRYLALIRFHNAVGAARFLATHDGRAYSPLEPELCHAVLVSSVEFTTTASIIEPLFDESDFWLVNEEENLPSKSGVPSQWETVRETDSRKGRYNFVEIPTCPVCLERIDSSASGVMIVICQHKFHCRCLQRWGDGRCPVCRYALPVIMPATITTTSISPSTTSAGKSNKPPTLAHCSRCGKYEHIWLCLICGNAGCGRYAAGHAHDHYAETGHNFALELATHRVWDYGGDNYVHRLINQEDGKLVELPGPIEEPTISDFPTENVKILDKGKVSKVIDPDYYSTMLVAQLESQRVYYEDRLEKLQLGIMERVERMSKEHAVELSRLEVELQEAKATIESLNMALERDRDSYQEDVERLTMESSRLRLEVESERAMSEQASQSTKQYNDLAVQREQEIKSLTEQLQDLMLHLEARDRITTGDQHQASGGTIVLYRRGDGKQRRRPR